MKGLLKKVSTKFKEEKGSEALQSLLLAGIALLLVVALFYPSIEGIFTDTTTKMDTWWDTKMNTMFVD